MRRGQLSHEQKRFQLSFELSVADQLSVAVPAPTKTGALSITHLSQSVCPSLRLSRVCQYLKNGRSQNVTICYTC